VARLVEMAEKEGLGVGWLFKGSEFLVDITWK